jgi:hypothetical protein
MRNNWKFFYAKCLPKSSIIHFDQLLSNAIEHLNVFDYLYICELKPLKYLLRSLPGRIFKIHSVFAIEAQYQI